MGSDRDTGFRALVAALPPADGHALCVAERGDLGLVSVMARPGFESAAAVELARLAHLVAVGPGNWLGARSGDIAVSSEIAGVAVFDQQAAFAMLEITGGAALLLLQKGVFVDLARHLGDDGASLCSVIARINVVLWRLGSERFLVAVPRSFAASFWHWLTVSAAAEAIGLGRAQDNRDS